MLAYREHAQQTRGIERPNFVKPETGHPAFDKACHLLGVELRRAPIVAETATVDVDAVAGLIDSNTIAIMGSACNYGYGTVDPISELSDVALERGVGLHVDGCLGGFILPWGQELGYDIPLFDFRVPGVTSISADTHKYGYGFKGSSVLAFRDKALRNSQYFFMTDWTGGKYVSPGHRGLPLRRAARGHLGGDGQHRSHGLHGVRAPDLRDRVRDARRGAVTPRAAHHRHTDVLLQLHGATTSTSTTSTTSCGPAGWRFNGQQYPNGIHMAVTRPQTQPGVVEAFTADLAEAVPYAIEHKAEKPASGAIYGGVEGGMTDEADDFIRSVMADMLDKHQGLPR